MLVTLLVVAMGGLSLQAITKMSHQSILLDEAHKRVEWSRQIQHALALQMNFTAMALLLRTRRRWKRSCVKTIASTIYSR